MPRRKELKCIASGIAGRFISRNNDIDGYWALGIFYKCAMDSGRQSFVLNILTGESEPRFKHSKQVAAPIYEFMKNQLFKMGFGFDLVKEAIIEVRFNVTPTPKQIVFKTTWGDPFLCKVSITDDLKKTWALEKRNWCGPHDPTKEHRSTRRL